MTLDNLDAQLLVAFNSLLASNDTYDKLLWNAVGGDAFVRGFPIFVPLVAIWFSRECTERRSRILIGLFATCLATIFSVWLQHHIAPHIRPLLDPTLHLHIADPQWAQVFDREGSFPSDTATLYFALSTVILLENRLVGSFCFVWTLLIIAIPRVAFGWHYPTDIIGAFILGPTSVYLFNASPKVRMPIERGLKLSDGHMYIVHAILFGFLADAYNLFLGLQQFAKFLLSV